MVWDLRRALLAKEEVESARLDNFDFRQRVRSMRLLAERLGCDGVQLAALVPHHPEDQLLGEAARLLGRGEGELRPIYQQCRAVARTQLIAELGDPTPVRLA